MATSHSSYSTHRLGTNPTSRQRKDDIKKEYDDIDTRYASLKWEMDRCPATASNTAEDMRVELVKDRDHMLERVAKTEEAASESEESINKAIAELQVCAGLRATLGLSETAQARLQRIGDAFTPDDKVFVVRLANYCLGDPTFLDRLATQHLQMMASDTEYIQKQLDERDQTKTTDKLHDDILALNTRLIQQTEVVERLKAAEEGLEADKLSLEDNVKCLRAEQVKAAERENATRRELEDAHTRVRVLDAALDRAKKLKEERDSARQDLESIRLELSKHEPAILQAQQVPQLEEALAVATGQAEELQASLASRDATIVQLRQDIEKRQGDWTRLKKREEGARDKLTDAMRRSTADKTELEHVKQQMRDLERDCKMMSINNGIAAKRHEQQLKDERLNALREARDEEASRRPASPTEMLLTVTQQLTGMNLLREEFGAPLNLLHSPGRATEKMAPNKGIHWRISPAQAVVAPTAATPEALSLRILDELLYGKAEITGLTVMVDALTACLRETEQVNFDLICLALKRVFDCWDALQKITQFEHEAVLALAMSQALVALGQFKRAEDLESQAAERLKDNRALPPLARAMEVSKVEEFCRDDMYCRIFTSRDEAEYGICVVRGSVLAIAMADHRIYHIGSSDKFTDGVVWYLRPRSHQGLVIGLRFGYEENVWYTSASETSWTD
ncbi:hypothetical protein QBC37DRAFT_404485 [Rhypophila decipiens]|uniref:Uncharacterized protein n=1 Tax=Rhypophila decipiens TaxID=261697 RepID=A0AAN7B1J2_9PEZI|nr:hypothetical protein QBC37DRAFT_404485 [Rhypophila decipiens]